MKISLNNNINFKASLGGEIEKIKNISRQANVSDGEINKLLQEVHQLYPDKDTKVDFFFRRYSSVNTKDSTPMIRSGVRIEKDRNTLELNIDPRNIKPQDLLKKMVAGIKKLATNQTQSSPRHIWFKVDNTNSWLNNYNDRNFM